MSLFCAISLPRYVKWFKAARRNGILRLAGVTKSIVHERAKPSESVPDAADVLSSLCENFAEVLASEGVDEETVHQLLKKEEYHVFLDPDAKRVWSKLPFGKECSDFVVQRSDDTYRLIELEAPSQNIFKKNQEASALYHHACDQVRDWQRYIRDNVRTVRDELGLVGIDRPQGTVVMGRESMIVDDRTKKRWRDMKGREINVSNYDELIQRVRTLIKLLRRLA